ncbi:MAG TPA: double zinc ribbon domain-containing protein [Terriglobales bacterium]
MLFPSHCRLCQAPLTQMSRLPVCHECLANIRPIEGPRCAACGERLMSRHLHQDTPEGGVCHTGRVCHTIFVPDVHAE